MKRLIRIFWQKEKQYWNRNTVEMKEKTSLLICILANLVLILPHLAFAAMHFLFETALLLFNRRAFDSNMAKLEKSHPVSLVL